MIPFKRAIGKRIQQEQFEPSWVSVFINPFFLARRALFQNIRELGGHINGKTLDVGCGRKPYHKLLRSESCVGLEIDTEENRQKNHADAFYDGKHFPFGNDEFDSAVCSQVLEHVFNPDEFLDEMNRILRPGGSLLLTLPYVWDEHEQPYDFARYSSFGLRDLLTRHGFNVIEHRKTLADVRVLFQLLNCYIQKKTFTSNPKLNLLITCVLIAPFSILGAFFGAVLPKNADLYLDNIVLAKKS